MRNQCYPKMANLSNICLQLHTKLFSNTAVDYFGPIQAKTSRKIRTQGTLKIYGVLSFNTRAIQIELSGELSTDSFIVK